MMVDAVSGDGGLVYNPYPMERPKTSHGRPKTGHGRRRNDGPDTNAASVEGIN